MGLRHSNVQQAYEDEFRKDLYTSLPGVIISYDAKTQTCVARPIMTNQNGLKMPPVNDVPVIFPSGGGAVMSFPVKKGERCWLVYSMYPISEWLRTEGDTDIAMNTARTHHHSECVAFVGLGTRKNNYQPHPDKVMIRFGSSEWVMDDKGQIDITANMHIKGKVVVTDTITGKDFISSDLNVSFNEHAHHYYWTDSGGEGDTQTPQ